MQRVEDLPELVALARDRRSVIAPDSPCWNKPRPAAVVLNLPGAMIHTLLCRGLYAYEPKPKPTRGWNPRRADRPTE